MVERKGLGYVIEVMAAIVTLMILLMHSSPSAPSQDWGQFKTDLAMKDVLYSMKTTGHMDNFLRRGETGTLQTAITESFDRDISIAGTVQNLPYEKTVIGYNTLNNNKYIENMGLQDAGSSPCGGQLDELDSEYPIMATDTEKHGIHLYLTDTDPKSTSGYNGEQDYDTLWVDNRTECQFASDEGPFYIDQFFYWGNSSDGVNDEHYDFKEATGTEITAYKATKAVRMRDTIGDEVNTVKTAVVFDTLRVDTDDLSEYNIIVFREDGSLSAMDNNQDKLLNFMKTGSVLALINMDQAEFSGSSFMQQTGLTWIPMGLSSGSTSTEMDVEFMQNIYSEEVETFYDGQSGSNTVTIKPGGKISSRSSEILDLENALVSSRVSRYDTDEWNATDWDLQQVDPATITGEPNSACVGSGPGEYLKRGSITIKGNSYDIISTEMGETSSYCSSHDTRAINIDYKNGPAYNDPGEGPLLNGDRVTIDGRKYIVRTYDSRDGEVAELEYDSDGRMELINYRTEFPSQEINKFARAGYYDTYTDDQRKLLGSVLLWMMDDQSQFGGDLEARSSMTTVGGIKGATYMPFRVNVRWR